MAMMPPQQPPQAQPAAPAGPPPNIAMPEGPDPDDSAPPPPPINAEAVKRLGVKLAADFKNYESDRRIAELRWIQNLRQYLGRYDPEVEATIAKTASKAYPKVTRVKCVSMVSRLMNLLFPANERNWSIEASLVPNLSEDDLNQVLQKLQSDPDAPAITDESISAAVRAFAQVRAKNLETEIEDQLDDIGGSHALDYVALCKRVLMSGVMYGAGVLKGPMARVRTVQSWTLQGNKVVAQSMPTLQPEFDFVPIWDYYPDMSAKYLHQMDGQFQRVINSRAQLRKLADNSEFMGDAIKEYLKAHQDGNYVEKPFERDIKSMGVHINTPVNDKRKYEILIWDGMLSGHYLKGCGVSIPESQLADMVGCIVWFIDGVVIRATLNPWLMVNEQNPISNYHHFIFEEDESSLLGNGLPFIVRDSQLAISATARMALDNASVACGTNLEVNQALLMQNQDTTNITAYKVWHRDDDNPSSAALPAVREIHIESHIDELSKLNKTFNDYADAETFVNPATGGDMQKGPSEPFRTATGASMLQGQAALPFKDVVRNFDIFTESVIGSLVAFNKHFSEKPSIKGDFKVVARGSTSLIAREVQGIAIDNIAQTMQPEERKYVKWIDFLRARLMIRDMNMNICMTDDEAKAADAAEQQAQAQKDEQNAELVKATVRKTLADAVKNISQAGKNDNAAAAAIYNAILSGLEKGVAPDDVAAARAGAGVPLGISAVHELKHPKPVAPEEPTGGDSAQS